MTLTTTELMKNLEIVREKYRFNVPGHQKEVFIQLIEISFFNSNNPGTIPNNFKLKRVHFKKDDIVKLLEGIGLNVEKIETLSENYRYGSNFNVYLKS